MIESLYAPFRKWSTEGTIWVISDTHFGDVELLAGTPGRPSAEALVKLINSKVGRKDTLILLGDVGDLEYARQLRGYKVLIQGNHDAGHTLYEEVFDEVYSGALMISEKIMLSHEPVNIPWVFNIHGHVHDKHHKNDKYHMNCCSDVIGYFPINFNQWIKRSGALTNIQSLHRGTIDKATERKKKRKK